MITAEKENLLPVERQHKILEILKNNKLSKLDEIHEQIPCVSVSTLRRDIKKLETENKIKYLFGGAVRLTSNANEIEFSKKALTKSKEKETISNLALKEIHDGDVIYIDSGSTGALLLQKLVNRHVTVYTTNTQVCNISGYFNANVILLGGNYNGVTSSLTGSLTDSMLRELNFDKAFLGINGVSVDDGYSTPRMEEAIKKRIVTNHSTQTFVLSDSSKFGIVSTVKAMDLNKAIIISDKDNDNISKHTQIICPENKN